MKKCNNCGFSNDDDARFCAGCGSSLADAPVVNEQAAPVQADDPFAEPAATPDTAAYEQPQDQQPQDAKAKKGFKGTVASVKDKTVGFEKKHSIILNAIVLVCALVVIFVALFAPIKVVNYQLILPQHSVAYEDVTEGKDKEEYTVHYVEISQSIWQIIGASSYVGADDEDLEELQEQLLDAREAAEEEYAEWALKNLDKLASSDDIDAMIDAQNKYAEIYAEHLSDINILGYVLASGLVTLENYVDNIDYSGEGPSYSSVPLDDQALISLIQAYESVGFAAVIVILSIVAAIISLVYLIKAIIGMIKKQPQNKLYKYFGTMLGLSGAGLILSMCTPLLAPGGGMLAIAVFISIMYFVCGAFGSFVFGQDGLLLSIKRTVIALLGMIAFFLLCSNVFAATTGNAYSETTVNAPMGYGFAGFLDGFLKGALVASGATPALGYQLAPGVLTGIAGFVTFIWMIFAVSFLFSAYKRTLKCLAFGNVEKSSCTALAITGAVFAIISIVVAMVIPGVFTGMVGEMFSRWVELDMEEIVASFAVRAQVWVSMIFFLVAAIFNIVFNPKSKNPAANQGQQA